VTFQAFVRIFFSFSLCREQGGVQKYHTLLNDILISRWENCTFWSWSYLLLWRDSFYRPTLVVLVKQLVQCVCPEITFELNDFWPRYLACWFSLTLSRSSSKVKVHRLNSGSQDSQSSFFAYGCTLCDGVFVSVFEFLWLKWSVRPRVRAYNFSENLLFTISGRQQHRK